MSTAGDNTDSNVKSVRSLGTIVWLVGWTITRTAGEKKAVGGWGDPPGSRDTRTKNWKFLMGEQVWVEEGA